MVKKLLFLLGFFYFFSNLSFGQGTAGKDFWVTFLEPDYNCKPPFPIQLWADDTLEIYISSPYLTAVRIEVGVEKYVGSGISSSYFRIDTLRPNKITCIKIPPKLACHTLYSDQVINNGVHISSDTTISVQAVTRYGNSKGATTVLPVTAIPVSPEYVITTNASSDFWSCYTSIKHKDAKSGEFAIVGIADKSLIEIIPTGASTFRNNIRGIPFVIELYKGQTFGYVSTDDDLTGSIIRSRDGNSKFAVFAGNRQTYSNQLNSSNVLCKSNLDHTYEQMLPTVTMGNSYTAIPFKNNPGGYYLKVLGIENFTKVNINGSYYKTIKQGEYFIWNVSKDTGTRVTADKRISVTQFSLGTGCNLHQAPKTSFGGVSQLQLMPDHQVSTSVYFNKAVKEWKGSGSSSTSPENYLNILVKRSDTVLFSINGDKVPVSSWKGSSTLNGYCYLQLDIDTLNYHLTCSKGFIAYAYGYKSSEGNSYIAAASFKPELNNFFISGQCLFDSTSMNAIKNDSFNSYTWSTGIGASKLSGTNVSVLYKDTGWYTVTMYCKHKRTGAIDSVTKRVYVNVTKSWQQGLLINDTMVCGNVDFYVYSKGFNQDNVYLWFDGHPNYYHNIKAGGVFWESVMERNGCFYIDTLRVSNYPSPRANFTTSDTLFCANKIKTMTFTNTTKSIDSIVYNEWDFGDQNLVDTHRIIKHLYKSANLYMVSLKVITKNGCSDDTFLLVNILPAPKATFLVKNQDSCFTGNKVTYTNTTVIDSANHMRYKWYFSDSFVISNSNPFGPYSYKLPGKNYAELIYENWNGCIDTMKKDINVYYAPKPVFSFPNSFNCNKDSIHIINKTTSYYKPVKNKWYFGDNKSDTVYSPVHFYAQKGTYNVKLVTSILQGCKDSTTLVLRIFGSPKADFSINDDIQCLKDNNFKFINRSTTDTGNFSVRKWTYSDGTFDQNTDTALKIFASSGNYTVKLKVASIFGCPDSIVKLVQVKNAPLAQFTVNKASQCWNSQNFVFTFIPNAGNDSIAKFAWYFNKDSIKNKSAISNIKFPTYGKFPVRLKLTSKYGCDAEVIQSYFLNPSPLAKMNIPKTTQCLFGNSFSVVTSSSIAVGSIKGYSWDFGDMTSSILQFPTPKSYTQNGAFKILLTVVSDSGCTDTTSSYIHIRPSAVITIDPVAEVCLNDTATLNGSATILGGFVRNYKWEFGDNATSDTLLNAQIKHFYKDIGLYTLKLTTTSGDGCIDSKTEANWVRVNELPNAAFKHEIVDGQNNNSLVTFTDLTQPKAIKRLWDFSVYGSSTKIDTTLSIIDTTTIKARLYITDAKGCRGMIEKNIFAAPPGKMYFPNAFTVNGDGINEGFGPVGIAYATNYKFIIYNRWGEMVFQSEKLGELWDGHYDGKLCPNGVYIYKLQLNDFFGKFQDYKGSLLLLW